MNAEEWQQIRSALEHALELPEDERANYLYAKLPEKGLRETAMRMLHSSAEASAMFPITRWGVSLDGASAPEKLDGVVLGNYRLIAEIGRGGMGAVYMAERGDGAYTQVVALKIMQQGILLPSLADRFRAERQILARLSHPGIARLLDGGVTEDQRPYLVMELVNGQPIDQYCEAHALDVEAKLRLFLQVANAVQAAHQQLILHLDLKPGNILVTEEGSPRLLDFGIARILTENEPSAQAEATVRLLTPRYASPEQAKGGPLGVASDVFSLATLLYRLLTGTLPYPIQDVPPLEAARIICEVEPQTPSAAAPGEKALRGDLDAILLKALRKDPQERYATVMEFADDVQRHLDSRPVRARKGVVRYRVGKFLTRNRVPVATAAVALLVIVTSMIAVVRSAVVARRSNALAERRLKDVRGLAHSYVYDLDEKLEVIPGTIPVRKFVLENAQKYLEAISQELGDDDDLAKETSHGYLAIGRVQATVGIPSLSDFAASEVSKDKALQITRRLLEKHPDDMDTRREMVRQLVNQAQTYMFLGDIARQEKAHAEAWEVGKPLLASGAQKKYYLSMSVLTWLRAMLRGGDQQYWSTADLAGEAQWIDETQRLLDLYRATHATKPEEPNVKAMYERVALNRAQMMMRLGRYDEARKDYDEALSMTAPTGNGIQEDATRVNVVRSYTRALLEMGDVDGAAKIALEPAKRVPPKKGAPAPPVEEDDDRDREVDLARIALRRGRLAEGMARMKVGLASLESQHAKSPMDSEVDAQLAWGTYHLADEHALDAATRTALYGRVIAVTKEYDATHPGTFSTQMLIGRCELGLASLAQDRPGRDAHLTAATAAFGTVLSAYPGQAEATALLARTRSLQGS